jgi:predicted nucleic-acid-binding protein
MPSELLELTSLSPYALLIVGIYVLYRDREKEKEINNKLIERVFKTEEVIRQQTYAIQALTEYLKNNK